MSGEFVGSRLNPILKAVAISKRSASPRRQWKEGGMVSRGVSRWVAAIPKWLASPRGRYKNGGEWCLEMCRGASPQINIERGGYSLRVVIVAEVRGGHRKCLRGVH